MSFWKELSRTKKRCRIEVLQRSVCTQNTPRRVRTCNLRFRRPVLYPVELGVRPFEFSGSNSIEKRRSRFSPKKDIPRYSAFTSFGFCRLEIHNSPIAAQISELQTGGRNCRKALNQRRLFLPAIGFNLAGNAVLCGVVNPGTAGSQ